MSTKIIVFIFIVAFYALRSESPWGILRVSPAYALDPIIIQGPVTFSPPPATEQPPKDVEFYSNDADANNTVTCTAPVTICQTFEPKCANKDVGGACLHWIPYDVTRIEGDVSYGLNYYQNEWFRRTYYHFASRSNSLSDGNFFNSMTNYDTFSLSGANNAVNRLTPEPLLSCLKGQRLYQAIKSLSNLDNPSYQVTSNEAVAWTDGSSVALTETRPGLTPVRLADIAIVLGNNPLNYHNDCLPFGIGETVETPLYDSSVTCFGSTQPESVGLPSYPAYKPAISDPFLACRLFQRAVQVTDIGSNARIISIHDDEGIKKKYTSIPLGNLATNADIGAIFRPANAVVPPVDICRIAPSVETTDKANAVTFHLVGLQNIFGTVFDTARTFCKTFDRVYKIDKRIPTAFASYNATLNLYLPLEYNQKNGLYNVPMGSEDGRGTYDPGNGRVEKFFYDPLRPATMQ